MLLIMFATITAAIKEVFRSPVYVLLALVLAVLVFSSIVLFPNAALVRDIISSPLFSLLEKARILFFSLGSFTESQTPVGSVGTVLVSLLFGVNAAMLVYAIRKKALGATHGAVLGGGGAVLGLLGAGCAACGSFLLAGTLSFFGAGALISALPLRGTEFMLAGLALLLVSIVFFSRSIRNAAVCSPPEFNS